jgi:hypothetical protein
LSARNNIVAALGETDRSALTKARACASNQYSFFAHRLNSHKDMGTTSLEIVEDRSETCDQIKEHDVRNLLDPTTDARQVLALHRVSDTSSNYYPPNPAKLAPNACFGQFSLKWAS